MLRIQLPLSISFFPFSLSLFLSLFPLSCWKKIDVRRRRDSNPRTKEQICLKNVHCSNIFKKKSDYNFVLGGLMLVVWCPNLDNCIFKTGSMKLLLLRPLMSIRYYLCHMLEIVKRELDVLWKVEQDHFFQWNSVMGRQSMVESDMI